MSAPLYHSEAPALARLNTTFSALTTTPTDHLALILIAVLVTNCDVTTTTLCPGLTQTFIQASGKELPEALEIGRHGQRKPYMTLQRENLSGVRHARTEKALHDPRGRKLVSGMARIVCRMYQFGLRRESEAARTEKALHDPRGRKLVSGLARIVCRMYQFGLRRESEAAVGFCCFDRRGQRKPYMTLEGENLSAAWHARTAKALHDPRGRKLVSGLARIVCRIYQLAVLRGRSQPGTHGQRKPYMALEGKNLTAAWHARTKKALHDPRGRKLVSGLTRIVCRMYQFGLRRESEAAVGFCCFDRHGQRKPYMTLEGDNWFVRDQTRSVRARTEKALHDPRGRKLVSGLARIVCRMYQFGLRRESEAAVGFCCFDRHGQRKPYMTLEGENLSASWHFGLRRESEAAVGFCCFDRRGQRKPYMTLEGENLSAAWHVLCVECISSARTEKALHDPRGRKLVSGLARIVCRMYQFGLRRETLHDPRGRKLVTADTYCVISLRATNFRGKYYSPYRTDSRRHIQGKYSAFMFRHITRSRDFIVDYLRQGEAQMQTESVLPDNQDSRNADWAASLRGPTDVDVTPLDP
ncbi:hypothetical protein J6590_100713 [Homalodisca vitripennis]|nr:hypothetical protein J6590_100713 [Homalodisca vitripennis]